MKIDSFLRENFSLEGRKGIVTGSSRGLGEAIAKQLANSGAKVYALSRSGKFTNEDDYLKDNIEHVKIDLLDTKELTDFVNQIGPGGIDFLVNNAGITKKMSAQDFDQQSYYDIQKLNIDSVFFLCQLAFPYLKKSQHIGRIINISSMAASLGFSKVTPYCISKSALNGLTRGLAVEWAKDNILVNSISPGWFLTELVKSTLDEDRKNKILNRMPLHRFGNPKEIAVMVQFLISPNATYITGQDFAVDGGALAYGY